MRHSGSYSFTLALRSIASCFLMFTLWEITHAIFEVYATQVSSYKNSGNLLHPTVQRKLIRVIMIDDSRQPMSVSQFASNPNQSLLSGLRSDEPYYQVRRIRIIEQVYLSKLPLTRIKLLDSPDDSNSLTSNSKS